MIPDNISYKFISTRDSEYDQERVLRSRMLREPMGLPFGAEIFPFEDEALHLVAMDGAKVVGCVMFHPEGNSGRLMQMAVASEFQGQGIGRELVCQLESRLKSDGLSEIHLHSRMIAIPFYENLGFSIYGEPFEEVGIEHRLMKKLIK
jgi:ribosomal protein S18 acetylase RimI-like enzyme